MIDTLDYIFANQSWAQKYHLAIAGGGQPIYNLFDPFTKRIWQMKSNAGFPWDMDTFDESYIYQSLTEGPNGWKDVNSFKMFASISPLAVNGAIPWMPRYLTPGDCREIVVADSSYRTYAASALATVQTLGGPIKTSAELVKNIPFGGDLGTQDAVMQRFFWGANFANMEVNCYVTDFGLVRWQLFTRNPDSTYTLKQTSLFNTEVAGGLPSLVLPAIGVPKL